MFKKTPGKEPHPDDVRMTIGEHLEDLRWRVVRSLVALVVACIVCIWPAKYLFTIIARPVVLVMERHGQPVTFLQTSPVEVLLIYIKVVVTAGMLLASPYILNQLWGFVAAGLYTHERRWVTRLVPWSAGLFLGGAVFMYVFVLAISLNFLVGLSEWVPLPRVEPTALDTLLIGQRSHPTPTTAPTTTRPSAGSVPILDADPPAPPSGGIWFNQHEGKLKVSDGGKVFSLQLRDDEKNSLVETHFKIGDYLWFFMVMTLAFGLAFQTPLVVLFLVWSDIVPLKVLQSYRKVVVLIIVFCAGLITPPDLLSHMMLSVPMVLLFELGMLLARRFEPSREADLEEAAAQDE